MTSVDGHRLLRGVFWARLAVAVLLLPLGILLPEGMTPGINHSVLALALLTVAASSGALLFGPPPARPRRIAWLVALLDVALVTGVVAATGGARSIFTFLYVMLVTLSGDLVPPPAIEPDLATEPDRPSRHEAVLPRPGDSSVPVRLTFWALKAGDEDEQLGVICACEDLTAVRAMEERLRQADRLAALGRMSANIAHEIRNPLASLTGAIEVLASSGTAGEVRERLAQIVLKESGRLSEILRAFLEYARPAPLVRARVNVVEPIDEVLVLLEHRAAAAGTLKIAREFPPSLEWVVDVQQFRQVVWNLCLNAVDAMPDGGEVRVTAGVVGDRLEVRVGDTGEGIAREDLGHVFEPFFSTKLDGSGLGLALVQRIMQEHGGEVHVESAPGAGSAFTLRFPAIRG